MMKYTKKNYYRNAVPFRPTAAKPYPNAAESGYFLRKALDLVLAAVTCLGVVSILMCMLLLG